MRGKQGPHEDAACPAPQPRRTARLGGWECGILMRGKQGPPGQPVRGEPPVGIAARAEHPFGEPEQPAMTEPPFQNVEGAMRRVDEEAVIAGGPVRLAAIAAIAPRCEVHLRAEREIIVQGDIEG